jgi:ElaB/YqjD/DUF883 family membrane-anchored ribosome-binding protein
MDEKAEVLKENIRETQTALTEKLEALEDKVASTVIDTASAVTDTVESVKDAVEHTVENVTDSFEGTVASVKGAFDLSQHMQNHPWMMLAGAALIGYLGGHLLGGPSRSRRWGGTNWMSAEHEAGRHNASPARMEEHHPAPERKEASAPSALGETVGKVVDAVKGLAIGATANVLGKVVLDAIPAEFRQETVKMIDDLTTTLGGKVLPHHEEAPKPNEDSSHHPEDAGNGSHQEVAAAPKSAAPPAPARPVPSPSGGRNRR